MCGIAGILRVHPPGAAPPPPDQAIPESWLDILDESIKYRGPDGHGRFRDRATRPDGSTVDVALVHRRLSIIDHTGGHQPMVSQGTPTVREGPETTADRASNLVAVVFNGCIYNHRDLRRELTSAGHHFVTDHSDTEVLIHGWREWGTGLPSQLDGMFGLALWDRSSASLVLTRDRFGEKPLYLVHDERSGIGAIAFASAPPGLAHLGRVWGTPRFPLADAGLHEWIRFGFAGYCPLLPIREVPPFCTEVHGGTLSVLNHAGRDSEQDFFPVPPPLNAELLDRPRRSGMTVDELDRLLEHAVASRLEADVPLGCFLSGGIDSALITHFAHRHCRDLLALTVRMPEAKFDESAAAALTARKIGCRHKVLNCSPAPAEDLLFLIHELGLPFGDSSLLPTHWVSRAARQHVKVSLAGDGGDELFLGYDRYRAAAVLGSLGPFRFAFAPLAGAPAGPDPTSRRSRRSRFADAAIRGGYADILAVFPLSMIERLIPKYRAEKMSRYLAPIFDDPPSHWHPFTGIAEARRADLDEYLPSDLLRKTDTASMSVALEVRSPMLGRELSDAVLQRRISSLMPRGRRKGLLRQVASRYLPPEIINRPKQGFAIPIGDWFRTDYGGMKTLLLDHLNSTEPWGSPSLGIDLNMKFVRQMLDEHMTSKRDHSQRLYMLLVLSIWAKSLSP